jgi:hypothetical protein
MSTYDKVEENLEDREIRVMSEKLKVGIPRDEVALSQISLPLHR